MTGIVYGLDVDAVRRGRDWSVVVAPGAAVVDGAEQWMLGYPVVEPIGTVTTSITRELRHWRDGRYPVLVEDENGPVRVVGNLTNALTVTLGEEDGYAVTYLPDQPPFGAISFVTATGLTVTPTESSYNRYRFPLALDGTDLWAEYELSQCVTYLGLTAVSLVGPVTAATITYLACFPYGELIDYDLSSWSQSGMTCTAVAGSYGLTYSSVTASTTAHGKAVTVHSTSEYKSYILTGDFDVRHGGVFLQVAGQEGGYFDLPGRGVVSVPCEGTLLTITAEFMPGSDIDVRGIYLVETADADARYTVGVPVYNSYVTATPYATIATAMAVTVNTPYSADFGPWSIDMPLRIKVNAVGMVSSCTSPYVGAVVAVLGGVTLDQLQSLVPGEYWYSGAVSTTVLLTVTAGDVIATLSVARVSNWTAPAVTVYADASSDPDQLTHRITPRLFDTFGAQTISLDGTAVTVHLVGGSLTGGTRLDDGSYVIAGAANTAVVAKNGSYAWCEFAYDGVTYQSPRVILPVWADPINLSYVPTTVEVPV